MLTGAFVVDGKDELRDTNAEARVAVSPDAPVGPVGAVTYGNKFHFNDLRKSSRLSLLINL